MEVTDPAPPPGRRPRRRALRLAAWLAAALAALLVLAFIGIPLPLSFLRGTIEARASEALGREVRVGALRLTVGLRPRLALEELHVAHVLPERPEVLGVARAELELALTPLLRRRVHVRRALVDGVAVRIDPEAFPEGAPEPAPADEPRPEAPGLGGWSLDVEELVLSELTFELQRPDLEPLLASLEQLTGSLLWDESLELRLAGRYQDVPISAEVETASLGRLIEGAEAWPLRLAAELAGRPIALSARVATVAEVYRIDDVQGRAGDTTISGWLALENLATKPRASGRIELGAIELVLPERKREKAPAAPGEAEPSEEEADAAPIAVAMGLLRDFETDLELEIERIAGIGPTVSDLSVALRVAGGELRFPVSLTADEIPLVGTLRVDEVEELPRLFFALSAEQFRVDTLAATLLPDAKIAGPFEKLELELEGRGDSLLGFLETLRFELGMADAALSYGVERPVPFGVETLELTLAERGPLTLMLRGDLLGERVELDLSGGTVASFLADRPWDLQLDARGAGATIELSGQAQGTPDDLDVVGDLSIRGERLSSLEPWLGTLPVPDAPYSILTRIDDTPERTEVTLEEVRLGKTNLVGSFGERRGEDELLWANLRIETLDVSPYVEAVRRSRGEATAPAKAERAVAFDAPILPGGLVIDNADFDLGVGKLRAGDLELADLRFEGAFRDGFLPRSDFGFDVGEARFAGVISADLREAPHEATFSFGTRDVDVGKLLVRLGLAEELDARAGALRIEVRGQGATLGDLVDESDFKARLEDVRWTLRDPNSAGGIALILDEGELVSPRGDAPVRLTAAGSLAGVPVRLSSRTEQLSFFKRPEESVPLELELEMAGATLEISSRVMLPIERSELELELVLSGRSLADASQLFEYELPPIGPYRLASRLRFTPQDYRLSDFDLRVGQSRLGGSGHFDLRGARPRIDLELASDRVQLDDFAAAFEARPEGDAEAAERAAAEAAPSERVDDVREFLSPEGLLGFDGRLVARAAQVLSGRDELGKGELAVRLEKGRLVLDPLHLELPGGPFDLLTEFAYLPRGAEPGVEARFRVHTDRFDYGPLARRVDPETDMEGWISLELDVAGTAPEVRTLLAHADGKLDFQAAPENIDTDVFDLWAVSLLSFIVPRLDPEAGSTLNCLVARFDLQDGIMEEKALLLDTTAMVVEGEAQVDFREERFRSVLTPLPKKAQLLSLQTRVEVDGSFTDFAIGVPPEELLATVVRFVGSVVVAPVMRVFQEPLPEDGVATCREAWERGRD